MTTLIRPTLRSKHNTSSFLGYSGEHIQYPAEETESDNIAAKTENHNAQRQPASPDKVTVSYFPLFSFTFTDASI